MPLPSSSSLATASTLDRHADTRTAALSAAEILGETIQGHADAVILFASFHHAAALPEAVETIRQVLHPNAAIGMTSSGVVGGHEEIESGPCMSVLALRFPNSRMRAFSFDHNDGPPEVWSRPLVRSRLRPMSPPRGMLVFADPFSAGSDVLPARMSLAVPKGTPIVGGLVSGASQPGANVLVCNDRVSNTGAVGILFEGDIEMETLLSHGCRPIGEPLVVTAADGPLLSTLGGVPAVTAVQSITRHLNDDDRRMFAGSPLIGIATNANKKRYGRNDFLIRPIAAANERAGTLLLTGPIRTGSTIQLQVRDATTAQQDLAMALDLATIDPRPPAASILLTCTGRGHNLFGHSGHDAGEVQRRLQSPPQAGMIAAAQLAPIGDTPRIHGLGVAAALLRGSQQAENTK